MTAAAVLIPAGAAHAASGTSSLKTTSGSLSIGTTSPNTITTQVGVAGRGILPSASWSDTMGTGAGWNGTVGVSDLTYTGAWVAQGTATALSNTSSGAFTDTQDGVVYTVTTGTITAGTGSYTWTSTDTSTGNASGSGSVSVAGTAASIGTMGITINFGTQSLATGSVYKIQAGTQSASAFSLDTVATGAGITAATGTTSANPTFVGNGTTVTGGGVSATSYSTSPVKFISAALNTGMGSYTVSPGVQVNADASSWAATYTAGVQYSIITGP